MLKNKLRVFIKNNLLVHIDKRKDTFQYLLIASMWGILFISSCSFREKGNLVDNSFITGKPCQAPCWYNLIPGVSTDKEVEEKLQELEFIDIDSITRKEGVLWPGTEPYLVSFNCKTSKREQCGYVIVSDSTLQAIVLDIHYDLKVSQVIEKLGPPEYIDYYSSQTGSLMIDLSWPKDMIIMSTSIDNKDLQNSLVEGESLPKDMEVKWVEYAVKERFKEPSAGMRTKWPGYK